MEPFVTKYKPTRLAVQSQICISLFKLFLYAFSLASKTLSYCYWSLLFTFKNIINNTFVIFARINFHPNLVFLRWVTMFLKTSKLNRTLTKFNKLKRYNLSVGPHFFFVLFTALGVAVKDSWSY